MPLDRQVNLYSVDTGHFYSRREERLYRKYVTLKKEQKLLREAAKAQADAEDDGRKQLAALIRYKGRLAARTKERLARLLKHKADQNLLTGGRDHRRFLNESTLSDKDVISMFESSVTRMLGMEKDTLTDSLIVVEVFYFDVFRDILCHGFTFRGQPYRYFTSSAGQIRKKKAVFMKQSLWELYEKTLLCGLTIDRINEKGGNNVNKHLAYMALACSATDEWSDFPLERSIVVEDFETLVPGTCDFIDDENYSVTRRSEPVPICHTDGAGMILGGRSRMVRAPWIKGLLGSFDFASFIRENNCSPVIRDIYGKEHDVLAEDIRIIFTKSQFKMWRFYDSWEQYQQFFRAYGCTAGICSEEESHIRQASLNYQMLQTLTDVTDEELSRIADRSVRRLTELCSCKDNLLAAFGAAPSNPHMTPLQRSVRQYPQLLNDPYMKKILRDIKDSLVRRYRCGKLETEGKYTFLLPDFYAACQYWFGREKDPCGLLADGEVYCSLFSHREELDCLRSPHLYREHAVRRNLAFEKNERAQKARRWFGTGAVYTSCHDLISRLLQFDVDGDKALVVADETFVSIARRNMKDIVPLYYRMRKAPPEKLTNESICRGLRAAFTGGNIGLYSNDISKIWNSSLFTEGTEAAREEAMHVIRLLCMENNFVIDYAKTLYKPARPKAAAEQITRFTRGRLPAFFVFSGDKTEAGTEKPTASTVNRLAGIIPNPRLSFRGLGLEKPDYRLLMADPDIVPEDDVIRTYRKWNRSFHFQISIQEKGRSNLALLAKKARRELSRGIWNDRQVCDMLVRHLYGKESLSKEGLWLLYGSLILENLSGNLKPAPTRLIACMDCGQLLEVSRQDTRTCRCEACRKNHRRLLDREQKRARRKAASCKCPQTLPSSKAPASPGRTVSASRVQGPGTVDYFLPPTMKDTHNERRLTRLCLSQKTN